MPRVLALALAAAPAFAASPDARQILEKQCVSCHGAAKMSGLDLRTRETALKGGARGPALVPGKSSQSLLYKAAARDGDLKMPPGKQTLTPAEVETLRAWIDAGADFGAAPVAESAWWSFKKPVKPEVPRSAHANPIDAFLNTAAAPVDRRRLIRRLTFDLHGLPPTPQDIDRFVSDPGPKAYENLVDRLLASPRYGERWGRHWLDVVRYADTGGYETDVYFANSWRYRDYVIRSFNSGKPYDVFVKEQIAADEIWPDNLELDGSYDLPQSKKDNLERRIGTSLFTLGALPVENSFFGDQYRSEWQAESVELVGAAFLGLSLNCARCHDHKFDPITTRDFYRLAALFAGSEDREVPIVSQMRIFEFTRHQTKHVQVEELRRKYQRLDPGDRDGRETILRQIGEAFVKAPVMYDKANLLVHTEPVPDTHILKGGDWKSKADKVAPGFPAALGAAPPIDEPEGNLFIPRRRKALAEWLASRDHPLTARVWVNRVWQGHFGRGIVGTSSDFGRQGEAPANPALLDWLAVDFMDKGWSTKQLHRLIVTSRAYQAPRAPRRIEAEALRDAILAASGALNTKMFGPPVVTPLAEDERDGMRDASQWPVSSDPAEFGRRSVYLFVKRSFRLPMFDAFDLPDPALSCARRDVSTVAPQALTLMNSEWTSAQSALFARRLAAEADPVTAAFRLALGRAPDEEEKRRALDFTARHSLDRLGLLLFNMNEFVYVD